MKLPTRKTSGVKVLPGWSRPSTLSATPIEPYSKWTQFAIPTYSQVFPSCVGHATANFIEIMLRKTMGREVLKRGQQIDGDAIWRRARKMFWPKEPVEDGGLLCDQGFKACIDLGLLPPDSGVLEVNMDIGMASRLLRTCPIIQGTGTSKDWSNPDPENGCIGFSMPSPYAGHATCIVGMVNQGGEDYVLFQNSWGASWGRYGYGLLRSDLWEQSLLGPLVVCKLPDNFKSWTGWRDFVITV